ncbi:MAG TPA: hypothetical protein VE403_00085 [Sphingomicrobium sp.]|nr:hypothetical protein [Sphingomicrobium sp.]
MTPAQPPSPVPPPPSDRERLGQILRLAFPVGEGGAFPTLLETLRNGERPARR